MRCVVVLNVPYKHFKPRSWIRQPLPRTYPSTFIKNDKGFPGEGGLFALRYVKALAYCCCLHHHYSTATINFFHVKALAYCCCLCHRYSTAAITFFHLRCVALAGCLLAWLSHVLHGLHTHCCLQRGKQGIYPKPPGGQEGPCSAFANPTSNR